MHIARVGSTKPKSTVGSTRKIEFRMEVVGYKNVGQEGGGGGDATSYTYVRLHSHCTTLFNTQMAMKKLGSVCVFTDNDDKKDLSSVTLLSLQNAVQQKTFHAFQIFGKLRQFTCCVWKPFDGYRHPMQLPHAQLHIHTLLCWMNATVATLVYNSCYAYAYHILW